MLLCVYETPYGTIKIIIQGIVLYCIFMILPIQYIITECVSLGRLRNNGSGLFAWIGLTALYRTCFIILFQYKPCIKAKRIGASYPPSFTILYQNSQLVFFQVVIGFNIQGSWCIEQSLPSPGL